MPSRPDSSAEHPEQQMASAEGVHQENKMRSLIGKLERGQLTHDGQVELFHQLTSEEQQPVEMVVQRLSQMSYSGPVPHPELLNQFDDETRRVIVDMAVKEQDFNHDMHRTGLRGSIDKDRRGQNYGVIIAVVGLLAAVAIAPFSTVAAGIIGTLDLFGMVALFVAPRVLESRRKKDSKQEASQEGEP